MIGYTITYKATPSAQPQIMFRAGRRVVKISNGGTVHTAGTAEDFAVLPPGVKAKPADVPAAKAADDPEAPRSTMARPARTKVRAPKTEE